MSTSPRIKTVVAALRLLSYSLGMPTLICWGAEPPLAPTAPVAPDLSEVEIVNIVSIPFRVKFMSVDFVKGKMDTIAINCLDEHGHSLTKKKRNPSQRFKPISYDAKRMVLRDGVLKNVPLLTALDQETGKMVGLPLNEVVNLPRSYTTIRFRDPGPDGKPATDRNLKAGDSFSLPAAPDKKYQVVEIGGTELSPQGRVLAGTVTIALPFGEKVEKVYSVKKKAER